MDQISAVETQIISLLARSDERAMDLLYDHYADALYGIVFRMLGDEEAAQDVLQEAFVKIWKNSLGYDSSKGRLFTWLVRIVKNQAIDALRRKGRSGEIRSHAGDVSMQMATSEGQQWSTEHDIGAVLGQLGEHERALLEHSYILGYTHPEIADIFGIPIGTVKTRIRTAMIQLHNFFGNGH